MLDSTTILKENNNVKSLACKLTDSKEDAEDLTQQVFIKAVSNADKFKGKSSVWTWLYRITMNQHIDNKRRARPVSSVYTINPEIGPSQADENRLLFKIVLEKELKRLDKEDR